MLAKTHLAVSILAILLFIPIVTHPISFVIIALVATLIPDIDSGFSSIGRLEGTGIVRFFSKHRGFFHSFSFCVFAAVIFAVFFIDS